ncbi:MAG: NAD(P)H-hydrate dehydratase, partial [Bacteroidota bacterium]|nr:NAD(P)H-hydrate dehydratase [Bacteroidota bacterium]
RLEAEKGSITRLSTAEDFPPIDPKEVLIDALFGTGLNKEIRGLYKKLIVYLNQAPAPVVSIDLPSGLYTDRSTRNQAVIKASDTLSFQQPKLAFFMAENQLFLGRTHILNIGLSREFYHNESSQVELVEPDLAAGIYRPRSPFAHKGDFGFAGLIAGSYGMIGAAVLSARACLRSGVGKLTVLTCQKGYQIIQTAVAEAMCEVCGNSFVREVSRLSRFDSLGIGPGIGQYPSHRKLLSEIFRQYRQPMVIDADALNVLSKNASLVLKIPRYSILTPHPKEFDRLFGSTASDFDRMQLALKMARQLRVYIILKGHYSIIATPEGRAFINSTGNPGMATAGSGDVLTGILSGLLAAQYTPEETAILGTYLHGLAGDLAAVKTSEESMIAGDIAGGLGEAFRIIAKKGPILREVDGKSR